MEPFKHVENVPSHGLTCDKCGNISLENLLRRYSIRSSSKSSRRSHPYLRPIENVCSEANNVHYDKWNRTLPSQLNNPFQGKEINLNWEKYDSATEYLGCQISHESPMNVFPSQKFKAGCKRRTTDELYCANNPSHCSVWKNSSPPSNVCAFQNEKNFILDSSHITRCAVEPKSLIDPLNRMDEICHDLNCDVCQGYKELKFYLESLIASGTGSGEALNLLQQHCCSHENDELEFECELCGCSFDCSVELISHLSFHPENWPYVCQLCRKRFKSSLDKQRHPCG